jgi:fumarate hydratase class II
MNSGPHAGLGEIALPALQPGSSIMPGKINPVIPEAVAMASAKVIGNDVTITVAGQAGSFQLNTMLPLIAYCLLESIQLLANSAVSLADKAIAGFEVRREHIEAIVGRNPILATALTPAIGYDRTAEIVERAREQGRTILDVAIEMTDLPREEIERLLDPASLVGGNAEQR